jgi:predicted  nucleic acid-binding Zn-ribbon protein
MTTQATKTARISAANKAITGLEEREKRLESDLAGVKNELEHAQERVAWLAKMPTTDALGAPKLQQATD